MFVSADSTCLVAAFQAFQMNHYCDSISFNDFEKIISNHLVIESTESAESDLLVSELIKSLDIDEWKNNLNSSNWKIIQLQ